MCVSSCLYVSICVFRLFVCAGLCVHFLSLSGNRFVNTNTNTSKYQGSSLCATFVLVIWLHTRKYTIHSIHTSAHIVHSGAPYPCSRVVRVSVFKKGQVMDNFGHKMRLERVVDRASWTDRRPSRRTDGHTFLLRCIETSDKAVDSGCLAPTTIKPR